MNANIKAGDMLNPDPLYNQTERFENRLSVPTKLLGVEGAVSQSGVLYQVQTVRGEKIWLDAGWFRND